MYRCRAVNSANRITQQWVAHVRTQRDSTRCRLLMEPPVLDPQFERLGGATWTCRSYCWAEKAAASGAAISGKQMVPHVTCMCTWQGCGSPHCAPTQKGLPPVMERCNLQGLRPGSRRKQDPETGSLVKETLASSLTCQWILPSQKQAVGNHSNIAPKWGSFSAQEVGVRVLGCCLLQSQNLTQTRASDRSWCAGPSAAAWTP